MTGEWWFDKEGRPIDLEQWAELHEQPDYKMSEYTDMEDVALASEIAWCIQMERISRETRQRMEFELQRRLEGRGASELPHPDLVVKLEYPSPTYDVGKLRLLAEMLPPDVIAYASIPEHVETFLVGEKWDARVFRNWGKRYGDAVGAVIEAAMLPSGPARLRISEKKT